MATVLKTRTAKLTQEHVEQISRALSDPRRFAILQQIASKDSMSCSCLEAHKCLSPATISHHIKELNEAGLIDSVREGRTATLTLRRDTWNAYLAHLGAL